MSHQPNTTTIQHVTFRELEELINHNIVMYDKYKGGEFEEKYFRERIRFLNTKKEALAKKIARNKKCVENASNEPK